MKSCTNWLGRSSCAQLQHLPKMLVTLKEDKSGSSACTITFLWAALFTYIKKWWKWLTYKNICYLRIFHVKMRHKSHSPCLLLSCCVTLGTSISSAKYLESNTKGQHSLIAQEAVGHTDAQELQKTHVKVIVSRAKYFRSWENQIFSTLAQSLDDKLRGGPSSASSCCTGEFSLKRTCFV